MKTLKIFVVLVIIFMVAKAYALKPMSVPESVKQESAGAILIHQGTCDLKGVQTLCMVGYKQETDTFFMLYFNNDGVLFQVDKHQGNKETVLWVHPHSKL